MHTLKIIVRGFLLLGVCLLSFIPQGLMQSKSCASELVLANRSKNQEVLRITRLHLHHKKRIRSLSQAIEGPQAAERVVAGMDLNHRPLGYEPTGKWNYNNLQDAGGSLKAL